MGVGLGFPHLYQRSFNTHMRRIWKAQDLCPWRSCPVFMEIFTRMDSAPLGCRDSSVADLASIE